jgi:hypothetical protein
MDDEDNTLRVQRLAGGPPSECEEKEGLVASQGLGVRPAEALLRCQYSLACEAEW